MKTARPQQRWIAEILALALLLGCVLWFHPPATAQTVTFIHNDVAGNPIAGSDAAGNLLWKEVYRPFGDRILWQGDQNNKLWFAGKPYESKSGLQYVGARYYDPVIGRFISVDPKEVEPDDVQSFNRYAYANNNPYRYVDPDGRMPVALLTLGFAAAVLTPTELEVPKGSYSDANPVLNASAVIGIGGGVRSLARIAGRSPLRAGLSAARSPEKSAIQIAREGGKYSGQLTQFMKQTPGQLRRSINSFDKRIAEHEAWVANPSSHVKGFSKLGREHQQNLIHHWQQDIARNKIYRDMAKEILRAK